MVSHSWYKWHDRHWHKIFNCKYEILSFLFLCNQWNVHVILVNVLIYLRFLVAESRPALQDSMDCSPPGSSVHGTFQTRILEWVAISFSNAWKWKVKVKSLSRVRLFETPWTAVHQAPPPVGFSRQEDWIGVPLPSPKIPLWMLLIPSSWLLSTSNNSIVWYKWLWRSQKRGFICSVLSQKSRLWSWVNLSYHTYSS